jgi:hypothetical protein
MLDIISNNWDYFPKLWRIKDLQFDLTWIATINETAATEPDQNYERDHH